jgi:D-glycerate 3-kinase
MSMELPQQIRDWLREEPLGPAVLQAVPELHLPLAKHLILRARAQGTQLLVGLCGSQGSGKSTAARVLTRLLNGHGLATLAVSIDDFYLTLEQRIALGHNVHPLLKTRGVPGTHDIPLAIATLESLRAARPTALPSFDKSTDQRLPSSDWRIVQPALDVIILEGWCVGAIPQPPNALTVAVNWLEREFDPDLTWRRDVNQSLAQYQPLFAMLDMLVLLAAPSFDVVYCWRREQEQQLRQAVQARGGDLARVMNNAQLRRFVAHYERVTRYILEEMPQRADVVVPLDAARRAQQPWPIRI